MELVPNNETVHAGPETHNDIHRQSLTQLSSARRLAELTDGLSDVLRVFDMTSSYGPYVGISRLSRWERAKKLGLNPPEEVSDGPSSARFSSQTWQGCAS